MANSTQKIKPRGVLKNLKCAHCKEKLPPRFASDVRGLVFCDQACSAAYTHARCGHGTLTEYSCAWCGQTVKRYPSKVKDPNSVFCSARSEDSCFQKFRRAGGRSRAEAEGVKSKRKRAT